jgi:hypothetical protein
MRAGKRMILALTLSAGLVTATLGRTPTRAGVHEQMEDQKKAPLIDIKGTVKAEDAKITFVADESGKIWEVINPETLKDYAGQHVELNVHVYADKGQLHVMHVTQL